MKEAGRVKENDSGTEVTRKENKGTWQNEGSQHEGEWRDLALALPLGRQVNKIDKLR
jgi:hypothetical protein